MNKKVYFLFLLVLLPCCMAAKPVDDDIPQNEFVACISNGIPNMHPHAAYDADEAQILTAVYEGLCTYDPYTLQPLPGLAKNWKVSADGLTWTFTLRDNLTFENGDPITAETFKASFINLLNPELDLPYASLLDCVTGVKDYRSAKDSDTAHLGFYAESDTSLRITLVYPAGHLANILCHHAFSVVHPSQLQTVERFAGRNFFASPAEAFKPIASGPFKIESFTLEKIRLVKNAAYWDAESVPLPSISLLLNSGADEMAEAFNQGSIHWLGNNISLNKIAAAHTIHITPMFATEYFYFRTDAAPCDDPAVRSALVSALPYDELRKDYLLPAKTLVFPLAGYPAVNGIERSDVRKAEKQLKRSAGKNGLAPIKILFPQTAYYKTQADLLKKAWETTGVSVEINMVPFEKYYDKLKTKDYHVAAISWIGDFADPLAFLELFRPGSTMNNSGWNNTDYEAAIKKASAEQNRKKRLEYLSKAEQLLLDSSVIIPLSHVPAINIIDLSEIKGWYTNAVNIHPFKFIRFIEPETPPGMVRL